MNNYREVLDQLAGLKLNGIKEVLDREINEAEQSRASYTGFLKNLLDAEVSFRTGKKLKRNLTGAHFPVVKKIEEFEAGQVKGVSKSDIAGLMDLRWLDNRENVLFFGPPGIGKTHLAISLGMKAIESGYTVCFERATNLMKLLKSGEMLRTAGHRINRLKKSSLVIIDEIGYTPIERREANLFFNLVSDLYEKSSIILTSNKGFDAWAEMMGDEVMTSAMLDRLLHHARVFNMDGKSYRIKGKED